MTHVIPEPPLKGPSEASLLECLKYHSPPPPRPQDGHSEIPLTLPGNDMSPPHSLHMAVQSHFTGSVDPCSDLGISGSIQNTTFCLQDIFKSYHDFSFKPYNDLAKLFTPYKNLKNLVVLNYFLVVHLLF